MTHPIARRRFLHSSLALAAAPYVITGCKSLSRLGESGFVSLFDGKTLDGWHINPEKIGHGTGGKWAVEDGAITGEQDPPGSGNGGILLTDQKFADFELRLDIKPDWGPDSGLFLRSNDKGQCFQMMVDYHDIGNVGHIYGEGTGGFNTRPFVVSGEYDAQKNLIGFTHKPEDGYKPEFLVETCTADQWMKAWKINDWNEVRVLCVGQYPTITTWINGLKICIFDGANCPHPRYEKEKVFETLGREGSIALQVHGGKNAWPAGMKDRWKNIRIKTL